MTDGNIRRKIIRFAVPVFIGHFFQQMYNTVDSLIVGNLINAEALAAVASSAGFTALYALSNVIFLLALHRPVGRIFTRLQQKYDL